MRTLVDGVVRVLRVDADVGVLVLGLSCDVSRIVVVVVVVAAAIVVVVVLFIGTPPTSSLHNSSTFTLPSGHVHSTPAGCVLPPP